MNGLKFDHNIAGARTLWILHFRKTVDSHDLLMEDNRGRSLPKIDFIIPGPGGGNNWKRAIDNYTRDALESLNQIQVLCERIQEDCCKQIKKSEECINKTKTVCNGLTYLDRLIRGFNDWMKYFK